jgi:hypothetical protein
MERPSGSEQSGACRKTDMGIAGLPHLNSPGCFDRKSI